MNQHIYANENHKNGKLFFALALGIQSLIILIWLILGVKIPLIVVFASVFLGSALCLSIFTTKKQRPRQPSLEWESRGLSSALGSSMYCSNCGMENARDSKYCVSCGFHLGQ